LIGLWGFIFGIPVAGALYATGTFFLDRWKKEQRERLEEMELQKTDEDNDSESMD